MFRMKILIHCGSSAGPFLEYIVSLQFVYSRIPISGTILSGRRLMREMFSVRSGLIHRQNVQRSAGLSCKRDFFPAY
jgi:hypothetical protein